MQFNPWSVFSFHRTASVPWCAGLGKAIAFVLRFPSAFFSADLFWKMGPSLARVQRVCKKSGTRARWEKRQLVLFLRKGLG